MDRSVFWFFSGGLQKMGDIQQKRGCFQNAGHKRGVPP